MHQDTVQVRSLLGRYVLMINVAPFAEHAPFYLPGNSTPNAIRNPGPPTVLLNEIHGLIPYVNQASVM